MVIIKLGIPALTFIMLTQFHNHQECIHTFHIAMIIYIYPTRSMLGEGRSVLAYFLKKNVVHGGEEGKATQSQDS